LRGYGREGYVFERENFPATDALRGSACIDINHQIVQTARMAAAWQKLGRLHRKEKDHVIVYLEDLY